ncbi:MAG: transglutaminase domain-containing protein [Candidatus Heimdallarchaeota archaeon]|nr:transglutaminase domain-containing protein [Candidatus Heimdallarchaeota archaeon]
MSKQPEKLKPTRKKLKTKPAVVVTPKRLKRKTKQRPLEAMMPKGIGKKNIFFTTIFAGLLVASIVNFYFIKFIPIALPSFFIDILVPVILFAEIFLLLLSFETYKMAFKLTPLRIILTIITGLVFFPFTLIKYQTRHNVLRIIFTGLFIGTLIISLFSPYVGLIGKYRDLPEGELEEQTVDADWFTSLFTGSAPFYIDGLLDLLDAIDLNNSLANMNIANISAVSGPLGNFLYRWEVYDRYNPTTWEFDASNDAVLYNLENDDYGPPSGTYTHFEVDQKVYAATTSLQSSLLTTWNSYQNPLIEEDADWTDNVYSGTDENKTTAAKSGTVKVRWNQREQLSLTATTNTIAFIGAFEYFSYFLSMLQSEKDLLIQSTDGTDGALGFTTGDYGTSDFNDTYSMFLQLPDNYRTISPDVWSFASDLKTNGENLGFDSVYQQIAYDLDSILTTFGLPETAQGDNTGQDRAQLLVTGQSDKAATDYLALALVALRIQGIPARPVIGFALGDGTSINRELKLENLFAWIEALLPYEEGGVTKYSWGQFQIVPYVSGSNLIYCENTLHSNYNLTLEMLGEPPGYSALTTQPIPPHPSLPPQAPDEAYMIDFSTDYTLRATATSGSNPGANVPISYRTYTLQQFSDNIDTPENLLALGNNIGETATDVFGEADLIYSFNASDYVQFDMDNYMGTTYILAAYSGFAAYAITSFVIVPEGYLSSVSINTTQQVIASTGLTESLYIIQKGLNYEIWSTLYEEPELLTVLSDRDVYYYVYTLSQLNTIISTGTFVPPEKELGNGTTDPSGVSRVYSINHTSPVREDLLDGLTTDQAYVIVANYGQNYTFSYFYYMDGISSTVDINSTSVIVTPTDFIFFEDFDFSLFIASLLGIPIEALEDEAIQVWMMPLADYEIYDGTKNSTTYLSELQALNDTKDLPNIISLGNGSTDLTGQFSAVYRIDASKFGAGLFKIVTFYLEQWNASVDLLITVETLMPNLGMNSEGDYSDYLKQTSDWKITSSSYDLEIKLHISIFTTRTHELCDLSFNHSYPIKILKEEFCLVSYIEEGF